MSENWLGSKDVIEISLWLKINDSSSMGKEGLSILFGKLQEQIVTLSQRRTQIIDVTESRDYVRDTNLIKVRMYCLPDFDQSKSHQMQSATSTLSGNGKK